MNVISRGMRNAFRNVVRTFSIIVILALSIGLALTMVIARQAVQTKIDTVKSSIGNMITISPAGSRGFEGGGEPLTSSEMAKVAAISHVVSVTETLQDRLTSTETSLQSAIEAGSLGRRFRGGGGGTSGGETGNAGDSAQPSDASGDQASGQTFTPPVTVTGTNNASSSASLGQGGGTVTIKSGKAFAGNSTDNVALVGTALATKNNLTVGSTFQAYGSTVTVGGIYDSGNQFGNSGVIMPLATVQRLSSQNDTVTGAQVQVDSISNMAATTTAIKSALGNSTADVVSQEDTSNQALEPLENIKSISLFSLVGAVVAGAVIILLTMLMIVRERRREIGVLKAIGASNVKVMSQFMVEAVTFTLIAAVVGLIIGVLAANPVTKALVSSNSTSVATTTMGPGGMGGGFGGARAFGRITGLGANSLQTIHAAIGWSILLYGLASALIIALIGSAIPAWLIAKVRPAEVMRAE